MCSKANRFTEKGNLKVSKLEYCLNDVIKKRYHIETLCFHESTHLVDGIGGTTWDGALILSSYISEHLDLKSQTVLGIYFLNTYFHCN